MENNESDPLDIDEVKEGTEEESVLWLKNRSFYLEFIPIGLIVLGLIFKSSGFGVWMPVFMIGGLAAAILYLTFSWQLFRVKEYRVPELLLSTVSAVIFPLGIIGFLIDYLYGERLAYYLLKYALYAEIALTFMSIALFIAHLSDKRASSFYRKILARLLIFSAILLRIYLGS